MMFKREAVLTAGGFLSFYVFGFVDNLKGPILPELLRAEQLSYSQGGAIFLGAYIGFMIATLLTGFLADLIGNQRVLLLAGLCLGVGTLGVGLVTGYPLLVLSMGFIGLGLGAIEVGGNGLMVELHSAARGRYLNLLATFHGVGSFQVPLYVAFLIIAGATWQHIYLSSMFLAGLLVFVFAFAGSSERTRSSEQERWRWDVVLHEGFTQPMRWYYLLIGSYVAVELGVAAWIVEFLQTTRGMSVATSSLYLSAFFVMIMLGRLAGSFVVERLGYLNMIGVALIGTFLCLVVGIFGTGRLTLILPLSGLCMSIVFPTTAAAVSHLKISNVNSILGLLFTFGGLGGALGPWCIGVFSDWGGLQIGLATTLGFCGISLFCAVRLRSLPSLP